MTKDNEDALWCVTGLEQTKTQIGKQSAAHLRRLVAENEALNHYRKVYGEVSAILACTAEMPPPSDDDEITVQRLKALVQDFKVYVDSCEAKADRIDRLGEAAVKLRAENEAKDALLRQIALTAHCGGLESMSEAEALIAIRKLTLETFKGIGHLSESAIRQHLKEQP